MSRSGIIAEIIGLLAQFGDVDILSSAMRYAMIGDLEQADNALSTFYEVTYA